MEFRPSNQESILSRLIELVESNLRNAQFGVSDLALKMGMSRSNLHRKVKSITNLTVSQFIRRIRLNKALVLLRDSTHSITEVANECGFHSLTYFTKCFNDYYGTPPSRYKSVAVVPDFLHIPGKPKNKKKLIPVKSIHLILVIPLFIIIATVLMIVFHKPAISRSPASENTIAVLLLSDHLPDGENTILVNGFMSEIRHKLSMVGDLNVVSQASVAVFLNTGKSIDEIGKELNVNYILEGKAQDIQGRTRIEIQLFDVVNDKNLWPEPIERELSMNNFLEVQNEVTLAVTNYLKVKPATKDNDKIERIQTDNILAKNLFLLGRDYWDIHALSQDTLSAGVAILKAKNLFEQAIELDSTFSDAYILLGSIYINHMYKMESGGDFEKAEYFLDSGLVMLDKALFYDPDNAIALQKKAEYFEKTGLHEEADRIHKDLSKQGEFSFDYYENEVMQFPHIKDYCSAIESYQKYMRFKPENIIVSRNMIRKMTVIFRETGFPELERQMLGHLLDYNKNSLIYFRYMISLEMYQEKFDSALVYAFEGNRLDPVSYIFTDLIALCYAYQEDFKMALNYMALTDDSKEENGPIVRPGYIPGYIHLMNGHDTEAKYHFTKEITRSLKEIEYSRPQARRYESHLYLAGTYLALGDEDKALDYLEQLKELRSIDYDFIIMLTRWPGFESIRNTPEYQDVLQDLQVKFQGQHQQIENLIDNVDLNPASN